jgi:hypothetical protein
MAATLIFGGAVSIRAGYRLAIGACLTLGLAVAVLSGLTGPAGAAAESANSPPVTVAAGSSQYSLSGVAVVSASDAWAVGGYGVDDRPVRALIEHWNGKTWSQVAGAKVTPFSRLYSVAAISASDGWAVGYYTPGGDISQTLIEHWNGRTWQRMKSPDVGGSSGWNVLYSVAASSPSSAWAVGIHSYEYGYRTLTVHWNGRRWSVVASPDLSGSHAQNYLFGVASASPSTAWAVGDSFNGTVADTVILRWTGAGWMRAASPDAGKIDDLIGVAAASPSTAWATGSAGTQTLIARWNGSAWRRVPSPDPCGTASDNLYGVAATSRTSAWTVGQCSAPSGAATTLAEHWNGVAWKRVPSPDIAGSQQDMLYGVAASRAGTWAVGWQGTATSYHVLIVHWTGTAWRLAG